MPPTSAIGTPLPVEGLPPGGLPGAVVGGLPGAVGSGVLVGVGSGVLVGVGSGVLVGVGSGVLVGVGSGVLVGVGSGVLVGVGSGVLVGVGSGVLVGVGSGVLVGVGGNQLQSDVRSSVQSGVLVDDPPDGLITSPSLVPVDAPLGPPSMGEAANVGMATAGCRATRTARMAANTTNTTTSPPMRRLSGSMIAPVQKIVLVYAERPSGRADTCCWRLTGQSRAACLMFPVSYDSRFRRWRMRVLNDWPLQQGNRWGTGTGQRPKGTNRRTPDEGKPEEGGRRGRTRRATGKPEESPQGKPEDVR